MVDQQAFLEIAELRRFRINGDKLEVEVVANETVISLDFPKHSMKLAIPFIIAALSKDQDKTRAFVKSREAVAQVAADGQQVWLEFELDQGARLPIEIGWNGLRALRQAIDELLAAGPSPQKMN